MWYTAKIIAPYLQCYEDVILSPYRALYIIPAPRRRIAIDDWIVINNFKWFRFLRDGDILWVDSALLRPNLPVDRNQFKRFRIITASRWDKEKLESYDIFVDDVIPRPFNEVALKLAYEEIIRRDGRINKIYDFAFIGWYEEPDRKNIKVILELAKRCPTWKFMIISNVREFTKLQNVEFREFGKVSDVEKFILLYKSKYYLHLSGAEGFGMPPLEAMATGLNVIYLNCPAHNEFLNHPENIRIEPNRVEEVSHRFGILRVGRTDVIEVYHACERALRKPTISVKDRISEMRPEKVATRLWEFLS